MKWSHHLAPPPLAALGYLACAAHPLAAAAQAPTARPAHVGPASVIVTSQFHGQIFGFDIDQTGTEGVLTEAKTVGFDLILAGAETFSQSTGQILKVVQKRRSADDFVTIGVTGNATGLVEREHVQRGIVAKRIYSLLNPLTANAVTGSWTPPLTSIDIIRGVSRTQGVPTTAFLTLHNSNTGGSMFVFGSNVAANAFGPAIALTDPAFQECCGPVVAYDSGTDQAVIASATGAVGGPPPVIALANLTTGKLVQFTGLPGPPPFGQGFVNGIAVDAQDGIACTTTELDARVEFYDLHNQTGFAVSLPGTPTQLQSGADVEYDPLNKLFLVAQPLSSTAAATSSIQVYDTQGHFVESLNGFNFSNEAAVVFAHIAINPATRSGFVNGPNVNQLQSFTY
jgi:hypothetical protein